MRPKTPPDTLPIFRSALQAELLARLYLAPERRFAVSELLSGTESRSSVFRELRRLGGAGLIERERLGGNVLYRAARGSPLYDPLRELIQRTMGVEALLERELAALQGVEAAAIFGSWAAGVLDPESDIDLLVVGRPDPAALSLVAQRVGRLAGREVNVSIWPAAEARRRVARGEGFLLQVLAGPLRPVVGNVRRALAA
jgi:predicted nucleotidyltransferase